MTRRVAIQGSDTAAETVEIDGQLRDLLRPVVPSAVQSLRLELGLTLRYFEVDGGIDLEVVRTVTPKYPVKSGARTEWKSLSPSTFFGSTWAETLQALGACLDVLYDENVAARAAEEASAPS